MLATFFMTQVVGHFSLSRGIIDTVFIDVSQKTDMMINDTKSDLPVLCGWELVLWPDSYLDEQLRQKFKHV